MPLQMNESTSAITSTPRRVWPWILAALVILGVILSVIGIRGEMERVKERREYQIPSSAR